MGDVAKPCGLPGKKLQSYGFCWGRIGGVKAHIKK
jgi:hypothetical protein